MRRIFSLSILAFLSFCSIGTLYAQTLTVTHTTEGGLGTEIQNALGGTNIADIKTLKIICNEADLNYNPDLVYIKNNFKTTLETLDLSEASFAGNKLPNGKDPWHNVGAFTGMTGLTTAILPDNVTSIGAAAFYGCTNLKTVQLPSSLEILESYVFRDCSNLELSSLPVNLHTLYSGAFDNCVKIQLPILPDALQSIGDKAFYYCSAMTASKLPDALKTVGEQAFDECTNVTFSEWPEGVTTVKKDAFRKTGVAFTTWPKELTTITNGVFVNAFSVTNFVIPSEVTTIEQRVFYISPVLNRTFTCKAETAPSAVDVGADPLLPTFGPDPAASQVTLNVLRKYASSYETQTPWSKMNIQYISHDITVSVEGETYGAVTSVYEHSPLTSEKLVAYEGDDVVFNITPNFECEISEVLLDGVSVKADISENMLTIPNIQDAHELTITFASNISTGINNGDIDNIYVYPALTSDFVKIYGADNATKILFDSNGRRLLQFSNDEIDISTYSNGFYLLRVNDKVFKIVKR